MAVFSDAEKIDVLIKSSFGVTSTDETLPWYNEVAEPFNQYTIGENILIDTIPSTPVFDTSRNPSDIGLSSSDFHSSNNDSSLDTCSIVDDSTGTVRRFRYLLLDPTTGTNNAGRSWTKKDTSGNNVLHNSLAFNYKKDGSYAPYESKLYRTNGSSPIQIGPSTGSWSYNTGTGILFFADYEEQSHVSTSNPPAFLVYVYIGQRGLGNLTVNSSGGSSSSGTVTTGTDGVLTVSGDIVGLEDLELNSGIIIQDDYLFDTSATRLFSDARFEKLEVSDGLTVYGDISTNSFNVVKNVTFSGDIEVDTLNTTNIIQFDRNGTPLDVDLSGDVYRNSITTFGNIDAGGMIIANGDISANGNLSVSGTLELVNFNVTNINASDNVGIGTTSPAYKMDIVGTDTMLRLTNLTTDGRTTQIFETDNANWEIGARGSTNGSAPSSFYIYDTDFRMVIDSGGNVGIGTTSPTQPLDVNGNGSFNGYVSFVGGGTSMNRTTTHGVHIGRIDNGSSYYGHIQLVSNDSGGSWIDFTDTTTGSTDYSGRIRYGSSTGFIFYTGNTDSASSDRVCINTSGFVGIGTNSPTQPLDVNGNGSFSGYVSVLGGGQGINTSLTHGVHIGRFTNGSSYFGHIQMVSNNNGGSWIDFTESNAGSNDYHGRIRYGSSTGFRFYTDSSETVRINASGQVGIGLTSINSVVKLHVAAGSGTLNPGSTIRYFNSATSGTTLPTKTSFGSVSILADNDILSADAIGAYSDRRIKKNIVEINDASSLEKLRLLKPSYYEYIDPIKKNYDVVEGFIAQEVKDVLPYAVKLISECIPNIFQRGNCELDSSGNELDSSGNEIDASNTYIITLSDYDTANLEVDSSGNIYPGLKLYDPSNNDIDTTIKEVISSTQLKIESNKDIPSEVFVYGQEVDNFNYLQKERVFTVGISALQEVDRQQQADKARIASLETENATLKTQMADVLTRLAALESA